AASFVGPPRPAHLALSPAPQDDTDTIILPPAPAPAEDIPSEGEALAAGLPLGELGSDVEVVVSERSVSFRVNSEILFDSSQADLSRSGLAVLRRIVGVLTEAGHNVTVEGHTDSVPVRRNVRYPSNWELSSARAGSVVRYMQANGSAKHRLQAIGSADTRPIAADDRAQARARIRRRELWPEHGEYAAWQAPLPLQLDRVPSPLGKMLIATDPAGRLRILDRKDHEDDMRRLLRLQYRGRSV